MSNYLAFATVTETLRRRLDAEANNVIPGSGASVLRPDLLQSAPAVNLFLYQVTSNAALRNADLPTRDSDSTLMQRPRAAFDLHYLLTFHGDDRTHEPQRILGAAVRTLHGQPVLNRQEIADAATTIVTAHGEASDLAGAVESVRFVPLPLSLEELSKLWSVFFQAKYALSVAYQASVVVIEGTEVPREALPVRSANVVVLPSLGPVIDRIASQKSPADPVIPNQPILIGYTLYIFGRNLSSANTQVRIGDSLVAPATLRDDVVTVVLSTVTVPGLQAGVTSVRVVQDASFGTPSDPHPVFESNRVPFVLAPAISALTATSANVSMTVAPPVTQRQSLALLLNDSSGNHSYIFSATATGTDLEFSIANVHPANYLVRLQVDGAESPLEVDNNGIYFAPNVTVPPP